MIYIAITFFSLLALYAVSKFFLYTLPVVEAGPISGVRHTGLQRVPERINASYVLMKKGIAYRYRRFVVQGDCMTKIGIQPKSIVSVRMFSNKNEKDALKPGDAVLIFLNDMKFRGYKIRVIKRMDNDKAETFYYDESGNERASSEPHFLESIVGVVDLTEQVPCISAHVA